MKTLLWLPKVLWRTTSRLFVLIRDDRDVREIYGDNPNGISEDERALNAGVVASLASNTYGVH